MYGICVSFVSYTYYLPFLKFYVQLFSSPTDNTCTNIQYTLITEICIQQKFQYIFHDFENGDNSFVRDSPCPSGFIIWGKEEVKSRVNQLGSGGAHF